MEMCGDGNTCLGSISSHVCVCDAPGYKINEYDPRECLVGMISFIFKISGRNNYMCLEHAKICWDVSWFKVILQNEGKSLRNIGGAVLEDI